MNYSDDVPIQKLTPEMAKAILRGALMTLQTARTLERARDATLPVKSVLKFLEDACGED